MTKQCDPAVMISELEDWASQCHTQTELCNLDQFGNNKISCCIIRKASALSKELRPMNTELNGSWQILRNLP